METSIGIEPIRHAFAARAAQPVLLVVGAPAENRTRSSTMARWRAAVTPRVRECASSGTIRVLFVGSEACSRVHLTREDALDGCTHPSALGARCPPHRAGASLSFCADGDEVRHRERRAPVGSRTRRHRIPSGDPSRRTRALVETPGNAPGTHACKARVQPSAHPLGTEPANRTLFSGLGNRLPAMGCSALGPAYR